MDIKDNKFIFLGVAVIAIIFFLKGQVSLDPDFGWHVRLGEYILKYGIPKVDPFSYTMPSFPFVDHEWLTNIFFAKLFMFFGKTGLALVNTFLIILALFISLFRRDVRSDIGIYIKDAKDIFYIFGIPLVLSVAVLIPFSGIRAQVQSWLWLAILLNVILNPKTLGRWGFLLPLFFMFWANLHGSFGAGIVSLGLVIVLKAIRKKKINIYEIRLLIVSILATLINPYGIRLWLELWQTISDYSLHFRVREWSPIFLYFNLPFLVYFLYTFILIWKYKEKKLEEFSLYIVFLLLSILSIRHIPSLIIVSLPITLKATTSLYHKFLSQKYTTRYFTMTTLLALLAIYIIFIVNLLSEIKLSILISENNYYPVHAVKFLRENPTQGQVFAEYSWGGYLIWKIPEKKVFIDGRMPSWRWNANIPTESNWAMEDFVSIFKNTSSFDNLVKKYGIDTILWQVENRKSYREYIYELSYKVASLFGKKQETIRSFRERLLEEGWIEVYRDSIAIIYRKVDKSEGILNSF